MTPCVRSHAVLGEHVPPCTCTRECPEHEGHCTGCRPVEATRGLLCDQDGRHLAGFLGAEEGLDPEHPVHGLPWAYDHLEHAYPSLSQAPGSGGSSIEDAEAQRLAHVVDLRKDMHDVVTSWVEAVSEHMDWIGPYLPDPPAGLTPDARRRLRLRRRAEWLLSHPDALHSHPAVAEAWQELADLMSRAHALAPWRPAPTHLDGIPCRCGATELHDHGDEILCWACRRSLTREEYRVATVVFARRFADDPRATIEQERGRLAKLPETDEPELASYGGRP